MFELHYTPIMPNEAGIIKFDTFEAAEKRALHLTRTFRTSAFITQRLEIENGLQPVNRVGTYMYGAKVASMYDRPIHS